MKLKQRQLAADYGGDVTTTSGAARYLRAVRPPRHPPHRGAYVSAVRRRLGVPSLEEDAALPPHVAWALAAVGHRRRTVKDFCKAWPEWVKYWKSCCWRPDVLGSPYTPQEGLVYEAFLDGVPLRYWEYRSGQQPPLAALILRRKGDGSAGFTHRSKKTLRRWGRRPVPPDHWLAEFVRSKDLDRMSKLSAAFLKFLFKEADAEHLLEGRRVNWAYVASLLRRFRGLRRSLLEEARVPAWHWASSLRWDEDAWRVVEWVAHLRAISSGGELDSSIRDLVPRWDIFGQATFRPFQTRIGQRWQMDVRLSYEAIMAKVHEPPTPPCAECWVDLGGECGHSAPVKGPPCQRCDGSGKFDRHWSNFSGRWVEERCRHCGGEGHFSTQWRCRPRACPACEHGFRGKLRCRACGGHGSLCGDCYLPVPPHGHLPRAEARGRQLADSL